MSEQPLMDLVREMRAWCEDVDLATFDGAPPNLVRLLNGLDLYHDALAFYAESWNWPGGHGDPGHTDMGSNVAKLALIGERHPAIRKEDDIERETGGTLPRGEGEDGPREDPAEG